MSNDLTVQPARLGTNAISTAAWQDKVYTIVDSDCKQFSIACSHLFGQGEHAADSSITRAVCHAKTVKSILWGGPLTG